MSNISNDTTIQVLKSLDQIKRAQRRTKANFPSFDLSSESTPPMLTADQNNYDPGNYDVLRLTSDANRTITGLAGGMKGRWLVLWNVGSYDLVFSHQSGSSSAVNRVLSATSASVTISPNEKIELYYDFTVKRWRSG